MSVHVMSWVFKHSEENVPGRRLVLLALADKADHDGTGAYPAVATIATETRMSERGVQYALRALQQAGRIKRLGLHPQYGTTEYAICMGVQSVQGRNEQQEGVQSAAESTAQIAPEPSLLQPTEEPSELPRPRSAADEDSEQTVALCDLLHSLIVGNDPKATPASTSSGWRDAARLLLDKDGRDFEEAQRVLRWCQSDPFWQANILSMPKFRDKYPQLRLKMGGATPQREQTSKASSDQWMAWAEENLPGLPAGQVASAAQMVAYAGSEVTAEAVKARLAQRFPELREVSS